MVTFIFILKLYNLPMIVGVFDEKGIHYALRYPKHPIRELVYGSIFKTSGILTGVLSVTQIVQTQTICRRQTWFDANMPILVPRSSIYALNRGTVIHSALFKSDSILKEVSFLDKNEKHNIIWQGRIDAYDTDTKTLLELKTTTKHVDEEPADNHILQSKLCTHLLEENGFEVDGINIIKMSMDGFKEFKYEFSGREDKDNFRLKKLTENEIEKMLLETKDAISNRSGLFSSGAGWACFYCHYYRYCPIGYRRVYEKFLKQKEGQTDKNISPPSVFADINGNPIDYPTTVKDMFLTEIPSQATFSKMEAICNRCNNLAMIKGISKSKE
ncbi:Dna2/Cas4 domain-containing protein [Caldisericum sp.]|uniref:Dna2/Cas4 domain-containing protein n=1 Tax=Caldisericum sp. TaxID=2499687 RepID=UPI003D0B9F63